MWDTERGHACRRFRQRRLPCFSPFHLAMSGIATPPRRLPGSATCVGVAVNADPMESARSSRWRSSPRAQLDPDRVSDAETRRMRVDAQHPTELGFHLDEADHRRDRRLPPPERFVEGELLASAACEAGPTRLLRESQELRERTAAAAAVAMAEPYEQAVGGLVVGARGGRGVGCCTGSGIGPTRGDGTLRVGGCFDPSLAGANVAQQAAGAGMIRVDLEDPPELPPLRHAQLHLDAPFGEYEMADDVFRRELLGPARDTRHAVRRGRHRGGAAPPRSKRRRRSTQ